MTKESRRGGSRPRSVRKSRSSADRHQARRNPLLGRRYLVGDPQGPLLVEHSGTAEHGTTDNRRRPSQIGSGCFRLGRCCSHLAHRSAIWRSPRCCVSGKSRLHRHDLPEAAFQRLSSGYGRKPTWKRSIRTRTDRPSRRSAKRISGQSAVPSLTPEILRAFDETAGPLFDRIVANEKENRTLAATRDFLLPKLMSGEIRVAQAEKLAGEAA